MHAVAIVSIIIVLAGCVIGAAFYNTRKLRHPKVDRGETCFFILGDKESGILYKLINRKEKTIYQAVFKKKISEYEYQADFENCLKHHKTLRTIDRRVTKSDDPSALTRKSFTYEGENIWDYLRERDVRIETTTAYSDKTVNWIYHGGEKIAVVEKAGHHHSATTYRVRVFNFDKIYLIFLTAFLISTIEKK